MLTRLRTIPFHSCVSGPAPIRVVARSATNLVPATRTLTTASQHPQPLHPQPLNAEVSPKQLEAGIGCVLGALIGDATGATLEFAAKGYVTERFRSSIRRTHGTMTHSHVPMPFPFTNDLALLDAIPILDRFVPWQSLTFNDEVVDWAMTLPGGGVHGVAPGQITDDGEMTLALLHSLQQVATSSHEHTIADIMDEIAYRYRDWRVSLPVPFDYGETISGAIENGTQYFATLLPSQRGNVTFSDCMRSAARLSSGSQANGSLMRCTPWAVFGHRLDAMSLASAAARESELTHASEECQTAVACYVAAAAYLVKTGVDHDRLPQQEQQRRQDAHEAAVATATRMGCKAVMSWLQLAVNNVDVGYSPSDGWVKYGFTHAFRHLSLGTDFKVALRETVAGGGDTDTNAAIVCGLLGAAHGAPQDMAAKVLSCETDHVGLGRRRPRSLPWIHPRGLEAAVQITMTGAPTKLAS